MASPSRSFCPMAHRHIVCHNLERAPPLTRSRGPTARNYAGCLNPGRADNNSTSTGQSKFVPSFSGLPTELRIRIWEIVIGPHRVIQVTTQIHGEVIVTSALVQSTAASRAAVSVSRTHRDLILEHILPNTITISGFNPYRGRIYHPLSVVRYKAARDILYIASPGTTMLNRSLLRSLEILYPDAYEMVMAKASWMHNVQKLAVDSSPRCIREAQDDILGLFRGLKELYSVCPMNEAPDTDDEDAEEDNPQDAPSQEASQNVSQETTLESFMEMQSTAPTPEHEHDNDAFLHTGTYKGVCDDDIYLSGRAALKWLGPRRSKTAAIQKVESYNKDSEERRQPGCQADMKLSILLHVIDDDEEGWDEEDEGG
ncbi:hypothetical protein V8C34DRAFT_297094 [Trichoderma compactum]